MPDLLFEILSEEMPAGVQESASGQLVDRVSGALDRLRGGVAIPFPLLHQRMVSPQRIFLAFEALETTSPDRVEERRGPKLGAPAAAIQGFLKAAGLVSLEEAENRDGVWFAQRRLAGQPLRELLGPLLIEAVLALSWPKSMRWGGARLAWVRPIRGLLAIFDDAPLPGGLHLGRMPRDGDPGREPGYAAGPEHLGDPGFLPFTNRTRGHRFLAPDWFTVTDDWGAYRAALSERGVAVDPLHRTEAIRQGACDAAAAAGLRVVADHALLTEIAGLVECPAPLLGRIEPEFMSLPPEVLTTAMRTHQKYFALEDEAGALAPYFVAVSNMPPRDEAMRRTIVGGYERVLRARLADARFLYEHDLKTGLDRMNAQLATRVFHAKLGTMAEKVARVARLAEHLARDVGADPALARRAARLAKADLSSGMVAEFPELQGLMGRAYALAAGEPAEVADALRDHYKPLGPSDAVPTAAVTVAVALADKLDTLAGLFAVGEQPTGSRDPFALRRAALGVVRLLLTNKIRLDLYETTAKATEILLESDAIAAGVVRGQMLNPGDVSSFIRDRLEVVGKDEFGRSDVVRAVIASLDGSGDTYSLDVVIVEKRAAALQSFLDTEAGGRMLAAHRRAVNILRIEEKKDGVAFPPAPDSAKLQHPAEIALDAALAAAETAAGAAAAAEDFDAAMQHLAALWTPLDRFFIDVTVNAADAALRENRLRILARLRRLFRRFADFSAIEG